MLLYIPKPQTETKPMALRKTYRVQLDVSLHRLGHDRDGITAARSLPHCIIVWQRLV